ncbi:hypothetical protein ADEAN_001050100 [Angomonas deanei]|uniref:Uncharacterized protein n=1 Tax=Angomonas deanei TaxID=59799 RepID=A0A7G2CTS9_9TRYP|nr:hypothetical protein ADEAN_001050100 [Angomonas deanei]
MLYPGGLTPQGIQQLRLPIILFDIPSQANQDLIDSLEKDEKNNLKKGTLAKRKKPLPPCVCLYLSPTRVDWYSGAAAGTTVSEDEANLKKTEDDEDSTNTKKKKDTGNNIIATRWQLPLRLAWAVTVHKSQGLTIPKLEIDMKKFFSPGQAYVALSRGKELKDIHVLHYSINAIRVCPVAKQFYKDLEKNKQPGVVGVYYKNQYSDQLDREKEQQEKEVEESESFLVGLLEDAMEASETTVQQQNEKSDEGTATTEKKGKGGKKKKKTKKVKEVEVEEESPLNSVLGEAMEVHNNNNNSVFSLQPPAEEDDEILDRSGKKKKEKTKNKKTEKKTTPKKSAAPADKKKNEEEESPLNSVLGEAMEVHNNNNIFHSSFSLQPPTEEDDRLDRSVKSNKKSKRPK